MTIWTVLVLMTSTAFASVSWLAARSVVYIADRRRAGAAPRWRPSLRQASWAVAVIAATGVGMATGHPFAAAIFLVPAVAVDHLCVRLWDGSALVGGVPPEGPDPVSARDHEQALHAAWQEALRLGVDAAVVGLARERCDALLRAHRAEPLELTMLEWVVFLRQRVPELVTACGEELGMYAEGGPRAERLQQITETLAMIGLESEHRGEAGCVLARRRFDLARAHALERISQPTSATSSRQRTRKDEACAS